MKNYVSKATLARVELDKTQKSFFKATQLDFEQQLHNRPDTKLRKHCLWKMLKTWELFSDADTAFCSAIDTKTNVTQDVKRVQKI